MPKSNSRLFDWLWPEMRLFETCDQAHTAMSRASLRSGLVPAVVVYVAAILIAPMEKYYLWVNDLLGRESVMGKIVTYVSMLLVGLTPLAIGWWLFRGRMRRCLRQELVRLGEAICVGCGYDLRSQIAPRCAECGAVFDAAVVASWLARASERGGPGARPGAVSFCCTWLHRRLFPELDSFEDAAAAREAWSSAMAHVSTAFIFVILGGGVVWAFVQWACFETLDRLLGSVLLWSPPLLMVLAFGAILWLLRRRLRRHLREQLAQSGVPICIECGYDLRGQTEARCPECGTPFDERLLGSTGDRPPTLPD